MPLDVMRDLQREGIFGELGESFYSTTGVATPLENAKKIGKNIADDLIAEGVDGVILTST